MSVWNLANSKDNVSIALNVDGTGVVNGTINFKGASYNVSGGWDASGSMPGRNASAFAVSGGNGLAAPTWISSSGIMDGPGNAPTKVTLTMDLAGSDGSLLQYWGELLPV